MGGGGGGGEVAFIKRRRDNGEQGVGERHRVSPA
jgi:hypothetical protein